MKLKELVRKKFEIDRFASEGDEEKVREKISSLQPEMENFESSTKDRFGIPYMGMGTGYASNIAQENNMYVPIDIETKFKALYTKYSNLNGSSDSKSEKMSGIILLIMGAF